MRRSHKRAQILVSLAVLSVTITQVILDTYYPAMGHLAPMAGFFANLIWIWVEEI